MYSKQFIKHITTISPLTYSRIKSNTQHAQIYNLPNHPVHDWRNISAVISICESTESQTRKTSIRQEQAVNHLPKYSSAKLIVRKKKVGRRYSQTLQMVNATSAQIASTNHTPYILIGDDDVLLSPMSLIEP